MICVVLIFLFFLELKIFLLVCDFSFAFDIFVSIFSIFRFFYGSVFLDLFLICFG